MSSTMFALIMTLPNENRCSPKKKKTKSQVTVTRWILLDAQQPVSDILSFIWKVEGRCVVSPFPDTHCSDSGSELACFPTMARYFCLTFDKWVEAESQHPSLYTVYSVIQICLMYGDHTLRMCGLLLQCQRLWSGMAGSDHLIWNRDWLRGFRLDQKVLGSRLGWAISFGRYL